MANEIMNGLNFKASVNSGMLLHDPSVQSAK